ncbi:TIGR01777 family oxidoreductase [Tolumonas lignilytica]|uniref:TIGR01777 family oxidoreductase n=1 Tax=Tolumonas lignilytica TaxID=1283284 RepID=UPI0004664745|nr:TIGR01777 family oxidoreductase [Tolumonas lignilytica]
MKILITGATGFIGQYLVNSLKMKHELLLISRSPKLAAKQLSVDNCKVIQIEQLKTLDDVDVIINLAGESLAAKRWNDAQKQLICESRWSITAKLLETLKKSNAQKPRIWINASAIGFYGTQNADPIDENFIPARQDFPSRVCAHWEKLAMEATEFNCRVCITRFGLVLGSQGGALAKMLPAYWCGLGGSMGSGLQMMSWITRTDLAAIILFLIEHPECNGIYNATTPNTVTNKQFSAALAATLHRPHFMRVPAWALTLLLGEMAELLLSGQNVQPRRLLEAGFKFRYPELKEALRHLFEDE